MKFSTHSDPVYDMGGTSNVPRKSLFRRRFNAAFICALTGHNLHGTGYANAHRFSHTDWRIGRYDVCLCCQIRVFDLESKEQFDEVLSTEKARWVKHFAEKKAEVA